MKNHLLTLLFLWCLSPSWSLEARQLAEPGMCQYATAMVQTISGQVSRPDGRPIGGITILIDDGMQTLSTVTDANGNYELTNLQLGLTYTITPQSNEDCYSCLNIVDVVAIEEHILNQTLLSTPYQRMAGDVNGSQAGGMGVGGITTIDKILLLQAIYGQEDPFSSSPCWTFVDAAYDFTGNEIPTSITVDNLTGPVVADFIAIKEGDVTECSEIVEAGPLALSLNSTNVFCQGEEMIVEVRVRDFTDIQGLQFSLQWDPAALMYQGFTDFGLLPTFNQNNAHLFTDNVAMGSLSVAWSNGNGEGVSLFNNSTILSFRFTALADGGTGLGVAFTDSATPALYVDSDLNAFMPTTSNLRRNMPGPQIGIGLSYCYNNQQFIPFWPTYVNSVTNQGAGTPEALPAENGQAFFIRELLENEQWNLTVNGPAFDGDCDIMLSGTTSACAEAVVPSCTPTNLSNNADFISVVEVWGNKVVWQSDEDGDNDIYLYDLATQLLTNITNNTADDRDPIIQGEHIAYRSDADGDFEIMLYNCLTQQTTQVSSNNTTVDTTHDIDGNYIVWRSNFEGDNDIYLYNILSGQLLNISDDNATGAGECSVAGDYAVFITTETGTNDVYSYHIPTGTKTNLTNDAANESGLVMNRRHAAWLSDADGDVDVYVANLFNGQITNVSNNTLPDSDLVIDSDTHVPLDEYVSYVTDQGLSDERYLYYLPSGNDDALGQSDGNAPAALQGYHLVWRQGSELLVHHLADGLATDYPTFTGDFPHVHNNHLVWIDDGDVFWYDLSLELPPDAVLDPDSVTDPVSPGNQATLWLAGFHGLEVVWYDDPELTNEVYADVNNNFQPVVEEPTTYYGAWRNPLTGCVGEAVSVEVENIIPLTVEFSLSNADVQTGEQFCLDLTAINFIDINALQFTIEYDPTFLQYLNGTADALTGVVLNLASPGFVHLSWTDDTGQGLSLPDGVRFLEVCFEALRPGFGGVMITGTSLPIEVIQGGRPVGSVGYPGEISIIQNTPTCPLDQSVNNDPGQCEAFVNIPLPDAAGLQILANDYNGAVDASDTYPVGSTDVTYSFVNPNAGDTTFCTFNVTVLDVEAPTLTDCPGNQTIQAAAGETTAVATWSEPAVADNCTVLINNNFSPGDAFPVGTTTVTYTAMDPAGNGALDCSFNIRVQGVDPVPVEFVVGDAITNIGTQVCIDITVVDFTDVTSFQYTVEYDPTIIQFVSGSPVALPGLQASLTAPGVLRVQWTSPGVTPQTLPDGSVVLTLCFDAIGTGFSPVVITGSSIPVETTKNGQLALTNSVVGSVTVLAGAATCPPNQVVNNDPGQCEAFVNIPLPDAAGLQILANDYNGAVDASDTYPVGSTDVTYSFVNPNAGDTTFCTFNVMVLDVETPLIDCAETIVLVGDLATGGAMINQELATAIDNCPGVDVLCAPVPREGFYECGITEVTCRAVDEAGNESEPCITVVEVICEPESCGPILTTTAVDTIGHDCCWAIDFSNPNDDIINAIKFTALDGLTLDYTLVAGYQDISHNLSSVLVAPDPLGAFPADVSDLLELCLSNVYVTPQTVLVDYYDSEYQVFCTDTLRFDCPPEPNCLLVLADSLVCDSLNGYRYDLRLQSPPGSDFGIGLLKMVVTSPADLAGTYFETFSPPLANGQFANVSFSIPGNSSADSLCFVLSAHNGPGEELCCFVQDTCLALPACDPCPEVRSALKPQADSCCYQLELANNYASLNFFTELRTTLLTDGVYFSEVDYELSDPWQWQSLGADDNDLRWTFNGGVPPGISEVFSFCVDGATTTDSICMEVQWVNREDVICRDTLKLFCPECILITQDTLTCDPATGIYTYTFSGENWSGGQDANTISLLESDPRFDLTPTSLGLGGTIPPLGSFGPLSFDLIPGSAQPGDTLCFDMVLRNVIQDSINIECCYVTHCIVLPECVGEPDPVCSCDDLQEDASCGFDIDINCYDLTLTPRCLLDDCDEVNWLNENGVPLGTTLGNEPITVTVAGPDNYTFLYQIIRTDAVGNICETVPLGANAEVPACNPDCRPENLVCNQSLSIDLQPVDPPTDVDGDGDTDLAALTIEAIAFVETAGVDCSEFLTYSIHRPGETPDPAQTSITLTCDDLGTLDLFVFAWDAAGQNNACGVQLMVSDRMNFCNGNRAVSSMRTLQVYPNPTQGQLILLPPSMGQAEVLIRSADGQLQQRNYLDLTTRQPSPLDVSYLRPGLYWLKMQYADGKVFYQRFIKQ